LIAAPETLAALLIAAGALVAALRLLWRRRDARTAVLATLSLVCGGLLYCALFPPHLPVGGETLVVATAETPADTRAGPRERLVALPEAPALAGAERVPDLATALRRHRQVQRLRIVGRGLVARDRETDAGLPVTFSGLPDPRGLVRLDPPGDTPAGSVFALSGEAAGLPGGMAELLDPAGRRVDNRGIAPDGAFTLGSTARVPGLAFFTLRLRGADRRIVSDTPVPLRTLVAPEPVRVLLVGAPSPEAKYLRRWAEDSGIDLQSRLDAGGGIDLGDPGARFDAATLRDLDVAIIDDRSLMAMGSGARAALANAVAGGLGVVIRMTAPATAASRESWRALGLDVEGGGEVAPVALPPLAVDAEALAVQRGPGPEDVPADLNRIEDPAPDLGSWQMRGGPDLVPAVRDADGALLAGWQQRGQGRVAIWTLANSFALVLNGQAERYYQWWSDTVSAVARAEGAFRPDLPPLVREGERIAICGLAGPARVTGPDGKAVALVLDPDAGPRGCAAFWPQQSGVHVIAQGGREGDGSFVFAALPEAAVAGITARETGIATRRWAAAQSGRDDLEVTERRGPAWPWWLGWLLVSAALWFLERRWLARPEGS
jgi:hypothetical protein